MKPTATEAGHAHWASFPQAAAASARARQVEWLASGGLAELTDPEARAAVWR